MVVVIGEQVNVKLTPDGPHDHQCRRNVNSAVDTPSTDERISAMAKNFRHALRTALERRYGGVENQLATTAGVDRGLLNKLLTGERSPSPATVGRIAGKLPVTEAHALLAAYLADVAEVVREEAGIKSGVTDSKLHKIASVLSKD
jgi:transcriptional regulator with XRE-family HTH domain